MLQTVSQQRLSEQCIQRRAAGPEGIYCTSYGGTGRALNTRQCVMALMSQDGEDADTSNQNEHLSDDGF